MQQIVMNLSILAAAAPSLHRFLNELHSSGFAGAIPSTQYELSQNSGRHNKTRKPTAMTKQNTSRIAELEKTSAHDSTESSPRNPNQRQVLDFRPDLTDRSQSHIVHEPSRTESGSRVSRDGSEDMIIRTTKAWDIKYDDRVQSMDLSDLTDYPRQYAHAR